MKEKLLNLLPFLRNSLNLNDVTYKEEVIAKNLQIPWAIAISDEGKVYFTERIGTIRVIENGKLNKDPIFTFKEPFVSIGEGGLLGIALDLDFAQNRYIYVMHSYLEGNKIYNRVVRLIEKNNKASLDKIIIDKIPGASNHDGGRIKIGPDKMLYITTGDAAIKELAQDLNSLAGKILRINLDGTIPKDNPFKNSPVYSLGHRNPQGLSFSPKGILYESEHGNIAHDEINIISKGKNYGWPLVQGDEDTDKVKIQKPLYHSGNSTWAPSGIAFIDKGPWANKLLVTNLRGQKLLVVSLSEDGTKVLKIDSVFKNKYGRLREAVLSKDGSIYITTSNRDGVGKAKIDDDKIIKLVPA